jgi:hypothetical protein
VLFESVFVLAVFSRSHRWRTAFVAAGFGLIAGFYLFHGLLWWPWLLVLLSFVLPWERLYTSVQARIPLRILVVDTSTTLGLRAARFRHGLDWFNRLRFVDGHARDMQPVLIQARHSLGRDLTWVHGLLIAAVCVHASVELPAGFGRFGSYSNTYHSIDEFEQINPLKSVDRVWVRYETAGQREIRSDVAVDAIQRLIRKESVPTHYPRELRRLDAFGDRRLDEPRILTLTREQRTFDWARGIFGVSESTRIVGRLDVDSMTLVAGSDKPTD